MLYRIFKWVEDNYILNEEDIIEMFVIKIVVLNFEFGIKTEREIFDLNLINEYLLEKKEYFINEKSDLLTRLICIQQGSDYSEEYWLILSRNKLFNPDPYQYRIFKWVDENHICNEQELFLIKLKVINNKIEREITDFNLMNEYLLKRKEYFINTRTDNLTKIVCIQRGHYYQERYGVILSFNKSTKF